MSLVTLIITAFGLSQDSLAMSAQKSLIREYRAKRIALSCALWFGLTQASCILFGWFIGKLVMRCFDWKAGFWVTCAEFVIAGIYNIVEARVTDVPERDDIGAANMVGPAVASSGDAMIIGLMFARESWKISLSAIVILALVTAIASIAGVAIGKRKGTRYNALFQMAGGTLLILLGAKCMMEGLGWISVLF